MKTIGIIGAMPLEINLIKDKLNILEEITYAGFKFYISNIKNLKIILTSCSIGKVNAASCTQILIDKFNVDYIINTGIAGSLNNNIKIFDIVISDSVTYHDVRSEQMENCFPFKKHFEANNLLKDIAIKAYKKIATPSFDYFVGSIISGETFIDSSKIKNSLSKKHNSLCVEMEGCAIGHVSSINNIPFLIIRSISDNADDDATISYTNFEKTAANNSSLLVLYILDILSEYNY